MSSTKIAIVCDGKEISFGFNLLHLFQYKNDSIEFISGMINDLSIGIYSAEVFRHMNISKKTIKVYVNDVHRIDSSFTEVYNKFGMCIYCSELGYILKADDKVLSGKEYEQFVSYANQKRKEYLAFEKQFVEKVEEIDKNWISKVFIQESSRGLFGKKNTKIQQQYDCLAFVMYMDFLKNKEM